MHLQLKPDRQLVLDDPFDNLPWLDATEDRREEHGGAAFRKIVLAHAIARPFVIFARTDHALHFVALRQVRAGDLVLVKGSRGIGTDLVVERLKGEFA